MLDFAILFLEKGLQTAADVTRNFLYPGMSDALKRSRVA
jgi:hypothetical protein